MNKNATQLATAFGVVNTPKNDKINAPYNNGIAMSKNLALVTGAVETAIAHSVVDRLLRDGYIIHATADTSTENKNPWDGNSDVTLTRLDHSDPRALGEFAASFQPDSINSFVNAQMYFNMEDPTHLDYDEWVKSIHLNLTMPAILTNHLHDKFSKTASLVFISSTEGFIGSFGASAYAASKAAIHNLVKSLANNLGPRAIRANAIAAGWIGGVMDTDDVFNMSRNITPLGRLGDPAEVASVVSFLLSADASFVNGATLVVDGGYTCVDTIAKFEFTSSKT